MAFREVIAYAESHDQVLPLGVDGLSSGSMVVPILELFQQWYDQHPCLLFLGGGIARGKALVFEI